MNRSIERFVHCLDDYAAEGATQDDLMGMVAELLWFVAEGCDHLELRLKAHPRGLELVASGPACDCGAWCAGREREEVPS